ncbi:TPA: tail fiber assembly protein, partial [Morganella morganii]|nr:tail fiber assembly protein [Morganella morganii]
MKSSYYRQYALDLGIATEDELVQLDKWKEYVVM